MTFGTSRLTVLIRLSTASALLIGMHSIVGHAQQAPGAPQADAAVKNEPSKDPLGRSTPRGTVMGFLDAARAGENRLAAQYLNARGARAEALARELFVVLDARLSGRLVRISDAVEGSVGGLETSDQEIIGAIDGSQGRVDIVLERVRRGDSTPIWLFSSRTLEAVPALYEEITSGRRNAIIPEALTATRAGGTRLIDYLAILFGLPLVYLLTVLLNRALTPLARRAWSRRSPKSNAIMRSALPAPARLLLVAVAGTWLLFALPLSLAVRQLWSNAASLVAIGAVAWLLVRLGGGVERHLRGKILPANTAAFSLLRVLRRSVDVLIVFAAALVMLRNLGIDPTPALAGLGVGGIAIALAAQKTLENVIAGASLIFDQAVRVGDVLKMGEVVGTVDHIGLRSTRIRTLDRTVVSIPNSQIASASLETLSSRDKFWFHPVVSLRYETTQVQLHAIVEGIRRLLEEHPQVDDESVRVRFFRLGAFSLDIEVVAYVLAQDWSHFLEIQERLLFDITDIVTRAGAAIAFPSQTMYFANAPALVPRQDALPMR